MPCRSVHRRHIADATTEDARKAAWRALQQAAFEDIPFVPLGLFFQPTAFRRDVTGIQSGFPLFYGVQLR